MASSSNGFKLGDIPTHMFGNRKWWESIDRCVGAANANNRKIEAATEKLDEECKKLRADIETEQKARIQAQEKFIAEATHTLEEHKKMLDEQAKKLAQQEKIIAETHERVVESQESRVSGPTATGILVGGLAVLYMIYNNSDESSLRSPTTITVAIFGVLAALYAAFHLTKKCERLASDVASGIKKFGIFNVHVAPELKSVNASTQVNLNPSLNAQAKVEKGAIQTVVNPSVGLDVNNPTVKFALT